MPAARHALFWLTAALLCALLVPGLSTARATADRIDRWLGEIQRIVGVAGAARIVERSRLLAAALDAGPFAVVSQARPAPAADRSHDPRDHVRRLAIDLACLRLATLATWLSVLLPLWIGAALQGWVIRDLRRETFASTNPLVYRASLQSAISIVGAGAVVLLLPVDLPAAAIPAGGALIAVPIACAVAHRPGWRG